LATFFGTDFLATFLAAGLFVADFLVAFFGTGLFVTDFLAAFLGTDFFVRGLLAGAAFLAGRLREPALFAFLVAVFAPEAVGRAAASRVLRPPGTTVITPGPAMRLV